MNNYGKLLVGIIAVWFAFVLSASALHVRNDAAGGFGLSVAVASSTPILVFFLWFAFSARFRQYLASLDPRILTFAQAWRILGAIFVVLEAYFILPAMFAFPAGYGDIFIGVTAPFIAWKFANPERRGTFILWQFLGITDLVVAVTMGTTAGLLVGPQVPMTAMTVLPLSLIPTFLVPLFLILHVICIAQARAWNKSSAHALRTSNLASDFAAGRY